MFLKLNFSFLLLLFLLLLFRIQFEREPETFSCAVVQLPSARKRPLELELWPSRPAFGAELFAGISHCESCQSFFQLYYKIVMNRNPNEWKEKCRFYVLCSSLRCLRSCNTTFVSCNRSSIWSLALATLTAPRSISLSFFAFCW